MKSNQSVHISIKQPPDPNPVRSLGIFEHTSDPSLASVIHQFLIGLTQEPKNLDFTQNVKDEAMKLLMERRVLAVSRMEDGTEVIYLKPNEDTPNPQTTPSRPRISK
jgi:hypothetical protein